MNGVALAIVLALALPPTDVHRGEMTPEEQTIAFLEDEIFKLKKALALCADDNLTSATIIMNQDEHIKKLRRSQKWKTTREWLRVGAGFAVGYAVGGN